MCGEGGANYHGVSVWAYGVWDLPTGMMWTCTKEEEEKKENKKKERKWVWSMLLTLTCRAVEDQKELYLGNPTVLAGRWAISLLSEEGRGTVSKANILVRKYVLKPKPNERDITGRLTPLRFGLRLICDGTSLLGVKKNMSSEFSSPESSDGPSSLGSACSASWNLVRGKISRGRLYEREMRTGSEAVFVLYAPGNHKRT